MKILPVIDLLGGQVVRGVAGRRSEYQPVASLLCKGASPNIVANALRTAFAFADVYVADLDAIGGHAPAVDDYRQIAAAGLQLWLDAGVSGPDRARQLLDSPSGDCSIHRLIVGLESIPSPHALSEVVQAAQPDRVAFSLDLKAGRPLARSNAWPEDPLAIADLVRETGISRLIVLDLADVGVGKGIGTGPLCREIRRRWPNVELIAGGGVRGMDDLRRLAEWGVDAALVASALHDGRLTAADVR